MCPLELRRLFVGTQPQQRLGPVDPRSTGRGSGMRGSRLTRRRFGRSLEHAPVGCGVGGVAISLAACFAGAPEEVVQGSGHCLDISLLWFPASFQIVAVVDCPLDQAPCFGRCSDCKVGAEVVGSILEVGRWLELGLWIWGEAPQRLLSRRADCGSELCHDAPMDAVDGPVCFRSCDHFGDCEAIRSRLCFAVGRHWASITLRTAIEVDPHGLADAFG